MGHHNVQFSRKKRLDGITELLLHPGHWRAAGLAAAPAPQRRPTLAFGDPGERESGSPCSRSCLCSSSGLPALADGVCRLPLELEGGQPPHPFSLLRRHQRPRPGRHSPAPRLGANVRCDFTKCFGGGAAAANTELPTGRNWARPTGWAAAALQGWAGTMTSCPPPLLTRTARCGLELRWDRSPGPVLGGEELSRRHLATSRCSTHEAGSHSSTSLGRRAGGERLARGRAGGDEG